MIELSHEAIAGFAGVAIVIFGGLISWMTTAQKKLSSIETKSDVMIATVNTDMKYLVNDVTDLKKNSVDHDRRIQRLEDSTPNIGVQAIKGD